jgi:hypothetical protein
LPYDANTGFADPISIESWAATLVNGDPIQIQSLVFGNYQGIGTQDLTGILYNLQKIGFWQKLKEVAIPGSVKTIKIHQGAEGAGYSFGVVWGGERNDSSDFLEYVRNILPEDRIKIYLRDSLWYHLVYLCDTAPDPIQQTWEWQNAVKVYLLDQYLYSEIHKHWDVVFKELPQVSEQMDNYGHLADGFESIAITGHYTYPYHVEDLALSVAGGDSIALSDALLSDEKITLGVDGSLVTEWTANLASLAHFQRDAGCDAGVTFSGDHILIPANNVAAIPLAGPWPTKKPIKVTANLTVTGTAFVWITTDNFVTYTIAITNANIENGVSAVYYLSGSAKAADIAVVFTSPTGSSIQIHSLKIERVLDCSGADLPAVQPGSQAAFTVSCDPTKSTSASIEASYHPRRYPV